MKHLTLLLLLAAGFAACDATDPVVPRGTVAPRALTEAEARIVAADNAFSFGLLAGVVAEKPDENVFLSPLSASMALGMTMNGAQGETRAAMETALGKTGMSPEAINAGYRGLIDLLPHLDGRVTFTVANSIFAREGFAVEPAFIDANRQSFDATTRVLDFADADAAAAVMNAWASEHTNGRIDKIMTPDMITPDLVMTLMNAIYFKAPWRTAFDPDHTRDAPFTLRDGTSRSVEMMNHSGRYAHYAGEGFEALDLPYGDSLYALTVLLPDAGRDINAFATSLDDEAWRAVLGGLQTQKIDVGLPRLKIEASAYLNAPLIEMGMGLTFTDAADFRGINRDGGLKISFVKQDTFVEMNEEGTEAAAVTVVGVEATSAPPSFMVNRPYVVVLREVTTGAILFAGRILDPAG